MPYAMLEKDIESLDETQQNAVALFVRFLLSKKPDAQRKFVAQALEDGFVIVTRDRIIPQYPVQTIW